MLISREEIEQHNIFSLQQMKELSTQLNIWYMIDELNWIYIHNKTKELFKDAP